MITWEGDRLVEEDRSDIETFFIVKLSLGCEFLVERALIFYQMMRKEWESETHPFNFTAEVSPDNNQDLIISNEQGATNFERLCGYILKIGLQSSLTGVFTLRYGEFGKPGVYNRDTGGAAIFDFDKLEARVLPLDYLLHQRAVVEEKCRHAPFKTYRLKDSYTGRFDTVILNAIYHYLPKLGK